MTNQELRQWLAEKVMEWVKSPYVILIQGYPEETTAFLTKEGGFVCYTKDWSPDTDLNQAFMVVERMIESGWSFNLFSGSDNLDPVNTNYAEFSKRKVNQGIRPWEYESHDYVWQRNANPALAICLAAVAALSTAPTAAEP